MPQYILISGIFLISIIGTYTLRSSMWDLVVLFSCGFIGFIFRRLEFDMAPMVLGLVLGPIFEKSLRETLFLSDGIWRSSFNVRSAPSSLRFACWLLSCQRLLAGSSGAPMSTGGFPLLDLGPRGKTEMLAKPFWEGAPRVELDQVSDWTIPAIIRERSRREPDNAVFAILKGDRYEAVTWRAFATMVAEVAVGLWRVGFVPGDRVAVMGDAALEWVVSDFGCLGAGGICVGIYETSAVPEVAHILGDSAPKVFFGRRKEHLDCGLDAIRTLDSPTTNVFVLMEGETEYLKPAPAGVRIMTLAELRAEGAEALLSDPALFDRLVDCGSSSDLARIIYTSGTTGRPKGVSYTHASWVLVGEQWVLRYPPLRDRPHRIASFLSTAHVASAMVTEIVPLVSKLVPHFASAKTELVDVFRIVRPDIQGMTPRFFQRSRCNWPFSRKAGQLCQSFSTVRPCVSAGASFTTGGKARLFRHGRAHF